MSPRNEAAFRIGILLTLVLTVGLSALAYSYLSNADDDPASFRESPDRSPESALNSVGAELKGGRSKFLKCVPPASRDESYQILFDLRGKPLALRVVPDPADPGRGKLVWDLPTGQRMICRGVRPGGFRVLEIADGWILKLEVVRMDRDGNPSDLEVTKTVKKK